MHLELPVVLGAAAVGLLVGLTGTGGGALMTPMLVLVFGVAPSAAISSDLVAAIVMRPAGAAVHAAAGTVNFRLAGWLTIGSVPAALLGTLLLRTLGESHAAERAVESTLGAVMLLGVAAARLRPLVARRRRTVPPASVHELELRPVASAAAGAVAGLAVGLTSVGAGSLVMVLLLLIYPAVELRQLVGTDLAQAVPLTLAAGVGSLLFGHVELPLSLSVVIGSTPAVVAGSLVSSRSTRGRRLRPAITLVVAAAALKCLGLGTAALAGAVAAALVIAGAGWWASRASEPKAPRREGAPPDGPAGSPSSAQSAAVCRTVIDVHARVPEA
ncbi:MAG TPA: sulfite exporter TauE/SafE family protein [Acidimicrobiales bacterium]|nr:sulfite exporter TauE/SafE family protein [Acidimicrobiales bacterium]